MPGKNRARSYTDYYKSSGAAPGSTVDDTKSKRLSFKDDEDEEETDPRKIALKRRLAVAKQAKKVR